MHKPLIPIAASALLVLAACHSGGPRSYYVDGSSGDDARSGRSESSAWKSLDKVNVTVFQPGEKILFKAGTAYQGQLHPRGSGTVALPIVVDMYGHGEKPLIAAQGKFHEALLLQNQEYWEVNNLQLTNTGPVPDTVRYGARVMSWDYGTAHHIYLRNLDVHDVNGSNVKRDDGEGDGILWQNGGDKVKSRFDDLLIEGCHLVRTDRNGICGYVPYPKDPGKWFPSLHVVIRGNLLEDIGGDAIKVEGSDHALVEHNIVRGARRRCNDYAAGIWPWASDNTVIQFNEVSGMMGTKDGEAFDSDGYCTNTIIQYNYSHDNEGGFQLICCTDSIQTTVRYNISRNDHTRLFHMGGPIRDVAIYNNLFYTGKGIDIDLFLWEGGREPWADHTTVSNNIFYADGTGRNSTAIRRQHVDDGTFIRQPGVGRATRIVFQNNVFYGNFKDVPAAWMALRFDPLLKQPGSGGDSFDSLAGYQLQGGSPAIAAGVPLPDNGGRDFWGNKVLEGKKPCAGAYEKP
jgi:hypothetical protein